jgi:hypothetical protein
VKPDKPNNSQLGALRSLLEDRATQETIKAWLDHLEKTQDRKDKWPKEGLDAIRNLATQADREWSRAGAALKPEEGFVALPDLNEASLKKELLWDWIRASWLAAMHSELRDREEEQRNKASKGGN